MRSKDWKREVSRSREDLSFLTVHTCFLSCIKRLMDSAKQSSLEQASRLGRLSVVLDRPILQKPHEMVFGLVTLPILKLLQIN